VLIVFWAVGGFAQSGGASFNTNPASPIDMGPSAVGVATPVYSVPPPFYLPFQIINSGSAALVSNYSFSSSQFSFDSATNLPNPLTVAASSSVTGGLSFTPSAAGTQTAQFVSTNNAPGSPHSVQFTGTGVAVAGNDFSGILDPSGPTTITVTPGKPTVFTFWFLAGPGTYSPSLMLDFQCSGGPTGGCGNGGGAFLGAYSRVAAAFSVTVPASSGALHNPLRSLWWSVLVLAVFGFVSKSYRGAKILSILAVGILGSFLISCGGSKTTPMTAPLVITANWIGQGAAHTFTVPLEVQ
jgi:hypothetical protein